MTDTPRRLRIERGDHDGPVADALPRSGSVEAELQDPEHGTRWTLVRLDEPFELQLKVGEPFRFRLMVVDAFLIRSRWKGCEIGDPEGVSVHLLLVERGQAPRAGEPFDRRAYPHVAWATCLPER